MYNTEETDSRDFTIHTTEKETNMKEIRIQDELYTYVNQA